MMVANSHNLIVTVKPANQRNNVLHRAQQAIRRQRFAGLRLHRLRPLLRLPQPRDSIAEGYSEEDDDDGDLIIENDNLSSYIPHGLHSSKQRQLQAETHWAAWAPPPPPRRWHTAPPCPVASSPPRATAP
ncbi:hypothetical protein CRUP_008241 [Coryphaenoides rupestris]|nr:hypothetical protein CRUP_008241 [Coryphaenoides rupestris]